MLSETVSQTIISRFPKEPNVQTQTTMTSLTSAQTTIVQTTSAQSLEPGKGGLPSVTPFSIAVF